MMPPIVYPLHISIPEASFFSVVSLIAAVISTVVLAFLVWQNGWRVGRPTFAFAGLVNLVYQWPIALFSGQIEASLQDTWFFAVMPNLVVFGGIAWVLATERLTVPSGTISDVRDMANWQVALPMVAACIFAMLYFSRMPVRCTAFFALLYDPASTLLAREMTVKLAGSTVASSSYGALANTVAPMIAAIASVQFLQAIRARRVVVALVCLVAVFAALTLVMVAGAKGLAVPLVGAVLFSAIFWSSTFKGKVAAGLVSVMCVIGALAAFELVRERGGGNIPYDLAGCAVELGSVKEVQELLRSVREGGGLGLSASQVSELNHQLEAQGGTGAVEGTRTFGQVREADAGRAATLLHAFFYRSFILPTQVAAWHHLYVDEVGSPGLGAFPLALKMFGYSVDATSLVYMKYGILYSDGDATSTSTAPTSFIFSWPAYFGTWGIAMAVLCILVLDLGFATVMRLSPAAILPLGVSMSAVIAFNMTASDFVTVMLSHGGAVAAFLLTALAVPSLIAGLRGRTSQPQE